MTLGNYIEIITAIVTIASVITAATPNQADNKIVDFVVKLLNVLAINFGKNKNYEEEVELTIRHSIDVDTSELND